MDGQNDSTAAAKAKLPEPNSQWLAQDACDFEDEVPHATLAFAILPEESESKVALPQAVVAAPAQAETAPPAVTASSAAKNSIPQDAPVQTTASATPFEVIPPAVAAETIANDAIVREETPASPGVQHIRAASVAGFEVIPAVPAEVAAAEPKTFEPPHAEVSPSILEAVIQESARSVTPAESAQVEALVVESAVVKTNPVETISSEAIAPEPSAPEVTASETTASSSETSEPAVVAPVIVQEVVAPEVGTLETPSAEIDALEMAAAQIATSEIATSEVAAPETAPAEAVAVEPKASEVSKVPSRPFRVKLRGSVLVLVRLPNRRDVRAAIHQLSTSGGVIHLEKPLDEKIVVDLIFHMGGKTIREKAQMLFPMWATQGWMQPFRFTQLSEADRQALDGHLKTFISGEAAKGAAAGS